jgi:alpha-beta hydrolase superfamily lysophospholipase
MSTSRAILRAQRALMRMTALLSCLALVLVSCGEKATPGPPPTPTPIPTATPTIKQVLDGGLYTLSLDGELFATESIRVEQGERNQYVIYSELRRFGENPITERRVIVVSADLTPQSYELERSALGVRSLWVGTRGDNGMNCLNNNLDWFSPVLVPEVAPAPSVMLESAPSALPYALLALRYDARASRISALSLDILEDLPQSRPLTLTVDMDRKGAVIGTVALEGQIAGALNARFTMWIRPGGRQLFSVDIPSYRAGLWQSGAPREGLGRLVIQRVSKLPEAPAVAAKGAARRLPLSFTGADRTERSGTLILPEGQGPFPCLVLHSRAGIALRWDPGDAFIQQGWAVYAYDKRGLGQSKGDYARGALRGLADDAVAAARMLRARPEIDADRIVFVGLGDAGYVGALALAAEQAYAGGILGACATSGAVFPSLVQTRIQRVFAPFYDWSPAQTSAYTNLSVRRWQQWLFEGQDEVTLAGRRVPLGFLKDWAEFDMSKAMSAARVPVLLLHGLQDRWTPPEGARALADELRQAGRDNVTLRMFDGLGRDLTITPDGALLAEVEGAVLDWLKHTIAP